LDTLKLAFEYRYDKALEQVLNNGGKYADLLAIDPESFGITGDMVLGTEEELRAGEIAEDAENRKEEKKRGDKTKYPKTEYARWGEYKEVYQKDKIRRAIAEWASLCEGHYARPELQAIAENLEAPYREVWHAAEIWNL